MVCNDPCTFSGFGEYVQGWITIKQTAEEARLFTIARERKWEMRELSRDVRQLEGDADALSADLAAAEREARAVSVGLRSTDREIELLESENDVLRSRLAALPELRAGVPAWAIVALAVAFLASAFVIRRRREPAFEIPDTVPDDLLERDRAGV